MQEQPKTICFIKFSSFIYMFESVLFHETDILRYFESKMSENV